MTDRVKYAVWWTPPPPVCTVLWDQDSWRRFEEQHRPEEYDGGMYDAEAWEAYLARKDRETADRFYEQMGIER
jgi:hypothetical protein